MAADAGVQAIIQPGGSIRDQDSIDLCNEKISLWYLADIDTLDTREAYMKVLVIGSGS